MSRKNVDEIALKVLYRLERCGYQAHLVGGCVRDLLLNHHPKDFDVATDAHPEQVNNAFNNCRLIGRRFRLAHIYFGRRIVEVATFRAGHDPQETHSGKMRDGMIVRDNVFGTIEEDAFRRDFTINALYYNVKDFSIIDFMGGMRDLKKRIVRIIGDAETRYREDPVRMIRAIRFAAKLDMTIERKTAKPFKTLQDLLHQVPPSRLFDEIVKLFHTGHAKNVWPLLKKYGFLETLFTQTFDAINAHPKDKWYKFVEQACCNTDKRIVQGKKLSCAFLFCVLLWPAVSERWQEYVDNGEPEMHAIFQACGDVLKEQMQITAIPRRFVDQMHDIWHMQYRLARPQRRSIYRCLHSKRFRAAYDLLLLRANFDPQLKPLAKWWTKFQHATEDEQEAMVTKGMGFD